MSENNINYWQKLTDEEFIHSSRFLRFEMTTHLDRDYIESRLKTLGYNLNYGCCGRNQLIPLSRI